MKFPKSWDDYVMRQEASKTVFNYDGKKYTFSSVNFAVYPQNDTAKDGHLGDVEFTVGIFDRSNWALAQGWSHLDESTKYVFGVVPGNGNSGTDDVTKKAMAEIGYIWDTFQVLPDTTGWQTYRNEENGYIINYPAGWSVQEKNDATQLEKDKNNVVTIEVDPERKDFVKNEFVTQDRQQINGLSFEVKSYGDVMSVAHVLYFERNGRSYIIQTTPDFYLPESDGMVINQILSTFKFIEPEVSPSP